MSQHIEEPQLFNIENIDDQKGEQTSSYPEKNKDNVSIRSTYNELAFITPNSSLFIVIPFEESTNIPNIKFFKKILQRLLTENKFNKYLLYSIG